LEFVIGLGVHALDEPDTGLAMEQRAGFKVQSRA